VTNVVPDPAATPPQTARVLNVANGLTVFRLLLVPVVAVALLHEDGQSTEWRIAACAVFAIASVTDRIDGDIARRRGLVTEFGKLADPLADKALTGVALVGLSSLRLLAWWVTLVILVREVGVTALRLWVIRHGVIPASRGGKLKTLVQSVAIGLYLLPLSGVLVSLAAWTMGLALVLTVGTGVDYVVRALTLRRTGGALARIRRAAAGPTGAAASAGIDAGPIDAGPIDAGPIDAGRPNAVPPDAVPSSAVPSGVVDAGRANAGPPGAVGSNSVASQGPPAEDVRSEPSGSDATSSGAGSSDDRPVARP
jgi:CDP-diacylglycerol--glycerol-3-phosphate 3-phosphatidyltransferase